MKQTYNAQSRGVLTVALAGNPNSGKTSLFNALTGEKLKCANYPGVTVDIKEGILKKSGGLVHVVDLPGVYSLESAKAEEKISARYLSKSGADTIVCVVDATLIERSLFLLFEIMEHNRNVIVALTMNDICERRKIKIDIKRLSQYLGCPVIRVDSRSFRGVLPLAQAMVNTEEKKEINVPNCAQDKRREIEKICRACVSVPKNMTDTDARIDSILLNRFFGLPIMLAVLALMFALVFTAGDFLKAPLESIIGVLGKTLRDILIVSGTSEFAVSLVCDGAFSGIFSVLSFLPNLFILYLLTAFLEDCGYMARIAYLADAPLRRLGLSGKAVIPLIIGFGCSVPAISATKTLENVRERKLCAFLVPFASCSAKLPVYIMLSDLFFGEFSAFAAFSMYAAGIILMLVSSSVICRLKKISPEELLIELPGYRLPRLQSVMQSVSERVMGFVSKAGSTVFLASVIVWLLLNFNLSGRCSADASFAAEAGRAVAAGYRERRIFAVAFRLP